MIKFNRKRTSTVVVMYLCIYIFWVWVYAIPVKRYLFSMMAREVTCLFGIGHSVLLFLTRIYKRKRVYGFIVDQFFIKNRSEGNIIFYRMSVKRYTEPSGEFLFKKLIQKVEHRNILVGRQFLELIISKYWAIGYILMAACDIQVGETVTSLDWNIICKHHQKKFDRKSKWKFQGYSKMIWRLLSMYWKKKLLSRPYIQLDIVFCFIVS